MKPWARRMTHRLASLAVLALLMGCTGGPAPAGGDDAAPQPVTERAAAPGRGIAAVATVFPLAWLAGEIAPEADVAFLGERGQDPHDLELSPSDRERIETADILLYMGELDFQPQIEAAARGARGHVVSVAAVAGAGRLVAFEHDDHDDDHDDHDGGDAGRFDPHVWFDAALMAEVAEEIGSVFARTDPDRAGDYEANAADTARTLRALEETIDGLLSDCRHDTAIVSHEAYAYLLEPRGLRQEGISGTGGHAEASPQRLAELTERIRARAVPAVAAEPVEGRGDAETLAREAGVELVEIHPLEAVSLEEHALGYPELLRRQAEAFATALGCGQP